MLVLIANHSKSYSKYKGKNIYVENYGWRADDNFEQITVELGEN